MKNNQNLVISFDIDGVLNHYPVPFIEFVNIELARSYSSMGELKLGLGEEIYKSIKKKYRTSNFKYNIPIDRIVSNLLNQLSENYSVYIFSRRPFSQFDQMYEKTLLWLENNNVNHHGLFYKSVENFSNKNIAIHVDDQIDDVNMLKVVKNTQFIVIADGISNQNVVYCPSKDDLGDVMLNCIKQWD
jgi:hypothetical protein